MPELDLKPCPFQQAASNLHCAVDDLLDYRGGANNALEDVHILERLTSAFDAYPAAESAYLANTRPSGGEAVAWRVTYANGEIVFLSEKPSGDSGVYKCEPLYASVPSPGVVEALKEEIAGNIVEMENAVKCFDIVHKHPASDEATKATARRVVERLVASISASRDVLSAKAPAGGEDGIADAVIHWLQDRGLLDAAPEHDKSDVIGALNDLWSWGDVADVAGELKKLKDPNAVHIAMLRGDIALPSVDQIKHIYQDALSPQAGETVAGDVREQISALLNQLVALFERLASAPASSQPQTECADALQELVEIIDKAGLLNLSNGVQLGQTSWYVKASERLERARAVLSKGSPT